MAEPQPDSSIKAWFHHHEAQIKRGLISGLGLIAVGLWFCGDLQNPTPVSADASKHCTNCLIYDPAPLPESKKLSPHSQEQIQQIIATGLPLSAEVPLSPNIGDQGSSSACGSFAFATAGEAGTVPERYWWKGNDLPTTQFDPYSVHNNLVGDCYAGTTMQSIAEQVKNFGFLRVSESPISLGCQPTFTDALRQKAAQFQSDFRFLFHGLGTAVIDDIKGMIAAGKSVVVGMFIGNQFTNYTCGASPIDEIVTPGSAGHAVVVYGYTADKVKIRNSWGPDAGCNGDVEMTIKSLVTNSFDGVVLDDKPNPPSEVLSTTTTLTASTLDIASTTTQVESVNNTLTIDLSDATASAASRGCAINQARDVVTCSIESLSPGEVTHHTVTLNKHKNDAISQTISSSVTLCGQPDLTEEDHPPCSIPETANFIDRVKKLFLSLISKDFSVR